MEPQSLHTAFEQLLQGVVDQAANRLAERLEAKLQPAAPLDLPGIVERYRRQLLDERPAVRPMRPDQKTRIL